MRPVTLLNDPSEPTYPNASHFHKETETEREREQDTKAHLLPAPR